MSLDDRCAVIGQHSAVAACLDSEIGIKGKTVTAATGARLLNFFTADQLRRNPEVSVAFAVVEQAF
jgi:hypothetical protein